MKLDRIDISHIFIHRHSSYSKYLRLCFPIGESVEWNMMRVLTQVAKTCMILDDANTMSKHR